jgi:hypothetical protein
MEVEVVSRRVWKNESGLALVAVLLSMAMLAVVGAALAAIGVVEFRTAVNHRSATRALLLADAGATHALALVRGPLSAHTYGQLLAGSDGKVDTEDDGYLAGFPGLVETDALPDTGVPLGGGRYFVRLVNDDTDPSASPFVDTNSRLMAVCRGETPDGGSAEVRIILSAPAFPAIATNGDLYIPGTPNILGRCAGIHSNENIYVSGKPTVDGTVTASGDVFAKNEIYTSEGVEVTPGYEQPMEIPDLDPLHYCDQADYLLKDGQLVTLSSPAATVDLSGGKTAGWKYTKSSNLYTLQGEEAVQGTYCVHGNVKVSGNVGTVGNPLPITVLATGSVDMGGTPVITSEHPEDLLIIAEGDVQLGGNTTGTTPQYSGLIYAGAQCGLNGTPIMDGRLLCYDAEDPEGAIDLIDDSKINGTPTIVYDCTGWRRQTLIESWWEVRAR